MKELSELNARLLAEARLEARLKEHVIEKIGLKTLQERLKENKSESVHKAMRKWMRAEMEKMQAALCGTESEIQEMHANIDQKDFLSLSLSDTVNEMRAALQQKEVELNLRASEHNAARKQNDEKMRYELELLSKAKSAEMDQVLATNRQKEQEYESPIHS